jgi:nitrite reductase/ring-hydroxylating ferredoxin subunit
MARSATGQSNKRASMSTKITAPYGAYLGNRAGEEDPKLTHVSRGTPCGEYLRRFWQPIALSSQLRDVPVRVRIMGEDLVTFRDLSGQVGVLELQCCHRNASLEFGKICERGIQCAYHGWHYDVTGVILDTPGEPSQSRMKERRCQGAYPAREFEGLVFAYMGPPDRQPEFPIYDLYSRPGNRLIPGKIESPCNWLQIRENEMDPMHVAFLHTRLFGVQFAAVKGEIPTLDFVETPVGMMYITTRRWRNDKVLIRSNDLIFPNIARVAGNEDAEGDDEILFDRRGGGTNWVVPVDDTHSFTIGWNDQESLVAVDGLSAYLDRKHRLGELPYEERQRAPGDWDVWVSQGPITRHENENLAFSDRGVALYRQLLRQQIDIVSQGGDPKGIVRDKDAAPLSTYAHNSVVFTPTLTDFEEDARARAAYAKALTTRLLAKEIPPYAQRAQVRQALSV